MATNGWGSDDSTGTTQSSEQDAAEKRARVLGVIAAGLGLMAARGPRFESTGQAIARAGEAGLGTYLGAEQANAEAAQRQQQMQLQRQEFGLRQQQFGLEQQTEQAKLAAMQPLGRDGFESLRGGVLDKYLPPKEMAMGMNREQVYAALSDAWKFKNEADKWNVGGNEVKVEDGSDGVKHMLVFDRRKNLISDKPMPGIPAKPEPAPKTDKTLNKLYLDPKTGLRWNVTYDVNTGKAVGTPSPVAGVNYGTWSSYNPLSSGPKTVDPPKPEDIPPLPPLERGAGAAPATGAATGTETPTTGSKVSPEELAAGVPTTAKRVHRTGGKIDSYMDADGKIHPIGAPPTGAATPANMATPTATPVPPTATASPMPSGTSTMAPTMPATPSATPTATPMAPPPTAAPTVAPASEGFEPVGEPRPFMQPGRKTQAYDAKTHTYLWKDDAGNILARGATGGPWKLVRSGRAYHRNPRDMSTESAAGIDYPIAPRIKDPAKADPDDPG